MAQVSSPPPRLEIGEPYLDTYGDVAASLASSYGLTPDPWQQRVLDHWLATDELGEGWSHLSCGLSVPRQNGKNALLEIRELFGLIWRGERILHTAHVVPTSVAHFRRLLYFFGQKPNDPTAAFPELNKLVKSVRQVNGREALFLTNGGSVEIIARSKNAARGFTVDTLVFDEAQEMSEEDLEALMPTTSAAPHGDPQWLFTGTPPGPLANGEIFTRVRDDALSGHAVRSLWHEWSAEDYDDLNSIEVYKAANPALAAGRLKLAVIEGERARFSDDSFMRERLGMWSTASTPQVIPLGTWAGVADPMSRPVDDLAIAVDVSPARTTASVALAGRRADGLWHVELHEQRSGVGWLVPYLVDLLDRNPEVRSLVIDGAGPAASIIDSLKQRRVKVTSTTARDMTAACGAFYDGAVEGWLRHLDQPQVNYAVSVARKRPLGDAWAWNRKTTESDITPIVACTLALWGAQNSSVTRPRRRRGKLVSRG